MRTPSTRTTNRIRQPPIAALYPKRKPHYIPLSFLPLMIILISSLALTPAFEFPDLGPLFNCDQSKRTGAFIFPVEINCTDPKNHQGIKRYEANVLSYHEHFTDIVIHQCTLRESEYDCNPKSITGFLYQFDKAKHIRYIHTTKTECLDALRTNFTKYGRLVSEENILTTKQHKEYSC